jgi:hypothetical protein
MLAYLDIRRPTLLAMVCVVTICADVLGAATDGARIAKGAHRVSGVDDRTPVRLYLALKAGDLLLKLRDLGCDLACASQCIGFLLKDRAALGLLE